MNANQNRMEQHINLLSHCPEEWSDAGHLADGANVLYQTTLQLTEVITHE